MRWKQREARDDYVDPTKWHQWFAWHPVTLGERNDGDHVWLEWVERRYSYHAYGGWWDYRGFPL